MADQRLSLEELGLDNPGRERTAQAFETTEHFQDEPGARFDLALGPAQVRERRARPGHMRAGRARRT